MVPKMLRNISAVNNRLMQKIYSKWNEEKGAALVIVLLVMMVLTTMSLISVKVIISGLEIVNSYKMEQIRLHFADSGVEYGYPMIERVMANSGELSAADTGNANVSINTSDILQEINGYIVNSSDSYSDASPDITLTLLTDYLKVDIDYIKTIRIAGSSTEFSSRYQGVGTGSAGGVGLYYRLESNYQNSASSDTTVRVYYKCIEGGGRCL